MDIYKVLFGVMLILIGLYHCFHYKLWGEQMFLRYLIFSKKINQIHCLIFGMLVIAVGLALAVAAAIGISWGAILEWIGVTGMPGP